MIEIKIAQEFTHTPGARYIEDGLFSGQAFREKYLDPLFVNAEDDQEIIIYLDGVLGYATSFLEEAFGGTARKYSKKRCLDRFKFITDDNTLAAEIISYIENSDEKN